MGRRKIVYEGIIVDARKCWDVTGSYDGMIKCLKDKGYDKPEEKLSGLTLEEIGYILGVTRERVRQIEEKALKKLRFFIFKDKKDFDNFI